MKTEATHVYLGIKPCGCAVAVTVDTGDADCRRDVQGFMRSGYTIERLPIGDVRTRVRRCECGPRAPAQAALFGGQS